MTVYIDLADLTCAPVAADAYLSALNLSGRTIDAAERDDALRALCASDGAHTVITGPGGGIYWSLLPPNVELIVDGEERARVSSVTAWFLIRGGMDRAEAMSAVKTPPKTERAKSWKPLRLAEELADAWAKADRADLRTLGTAVNGARPSTAPHGRPSRPSPDPVNPADLLVTDREDRPFRYRIADEPISIAAMSRAIGEWRQEGRTFGLDTEGTDKQPHRAELVGFALAMGEMVWYAPVRTHEGPAPYPAGRLVPPLRRWGALALSVLEEHVTAPGSIRWAGWNGGGYDYLLLRRNGVSMQRAALVADGELAAYVYAQGTTEKGAKGLKQSVARWFDYQMTTFEQVLALGERATGKSCPDISYVPVEIVAPYCAEDAYWHVRCEEMIREELVRSGVRLEMYTDVELPIAMILAEMELAGLPVDLNEARRWRNGWMKIVRDLREQVKAAALEAGWAPRKPDRRGCAAHGRKKKDIAACETCDAEGKVIFPTAFNPAAPLHVSDVLQRCLALPALGTTEKTGQPQNDEPKLLLLRQLSPAGGLAERFITLLLNYKRESKLLKTYLIPFVVETTPVRDEPRGRDTALPSRGLLHTQFNQVGTRSMRLSSSDPINAQNIPVGPRVIFSAPPGTKLWGADYSQIELRIIARVSGCRSMIDTFVDGGDVHSLAAWRVFGVPEERAKSDPAIRHRAKTMNFCVVYGGEAEIVQELITKAALNEPDLGLTVPSLSECREMLKEYRKAFPEVFEWKSGYLEMCARRGWSETMYGFRRYLPDLTHPNAQLRKSAERQAVNLVPQGTAGQIIKIAMIALSERMGAYGADIRNQVHDEVWGVIAEQDEHGNAVDHAAWLHEVEVCMLLDQPLQPVPLVVEPKIVSNWRELK